MDAQGLHDANHRRGYIAVALKFDDDHLGHADAVAGSEVREPQAEIDGQPFGFLPVNERYTRELRAQARADLLVVIPALGSQEIVHTPGLFALADHVGREAGGGQCDTFLLGAAFVVLALDLKEEEVTLDVGAYANLLANELAVVMTDVHLPVGGVVIDRVVVACSFAGDGLYEVTVLRHAEQFGQQTQWHHELRIDTVHEFHALHLAERDRGEVLQYVRQRIYRVNN